METRHLLTLLSSHPGDQSPAPGTEHPREQALIRIPQRDGAGVRSLTI